MRHDWNSLLGDGTSPMTERTRDLYPHADELYVHARTQARYFAPARCVTGGVLSRQHVSTSARQHVSTCRTNPRAGSVVALLFVRLSCCRVLN